MTGVVGRLTAALADRYRIERELGQGGMATVYLAQDLKHDRKVALKVLKPELAAVLGAERFVVEIKTTASLQHPHILPLFDSGTAEGFLFYVMPFIEGETLRDKLNRETQLGVDEAVRIAREVADALDYAHGKGVIHRDIKPENILIQNGRPMVADFGIALAVSAAAGGRMTETGLSLGTPHYMSPEQATADKEISGRSDIYSLASVLYEMLAGQPPHLGGSAQQIIMKIIAEPVQSVTALRKSVPPNVAAALDRALEKLPADRFPSAREFGDALLNPAFASSAGPGTRAGAPRPPSWRERAAIPALVLVVALALTTALALQRQQPPAPLSRYQVELPDGKGLGNTQWSPMAISPDGSHLAYIGESGRIVVRSREQLQPVELDGTDGAYNPFFSPDGLRVGFMSGAAGNAELRVVSLAGGPPVTVTSKGVGGPGVSWGADGFIYFDASGVGPLRRVRETGGQPFETVSTLDSVAGELQHDWPDALPNGRGVLVTINRGGPGVNISQSDDIGVIDLASGKHRVLVHGVFARYAASGHIIFVTAERVLMGVPFDQDRLEVTGNPLALVEGINIRIGGGGVDLAISRTGTLW
jgi:serine/threonine protein kinase